MMRCAIVCLPILVFMFVSCAGPGHEATPVFHGWSIAVQEEGHARSMPDEASWRPIAVPRYVYLPRRQNECSYLIWLRGTCTINADPSLYHGISTGRMKYGDELFVNGNRIGSTETGNFGLVPLRRHYPFPHYCGRPSLVKGENTILFRIEAPAGEYAGMAGNVSLLAEKEFQRSLFFHGLIYREIPIGIIILFSSSALSLFILYFLGRRDRLILSCMFADLCLLAYLVSRYLPVWLASPPLFLSVQWAGVFVFSASVLLMTQAIYRVYIARINAVLVPMLLAGALAIILGIGKVTGTAPVEWASAAGIAAAIAFYSVMTWRFHDNQRDRIILYLYASIIIISSSIIIVENVIRMTGSTHTDLVVAYGFPLVILVFHALLARDYINKTMEIETLYRTLKGSGKSGRVSITETAGEKLNRVIDFISKNYTSDIAREGLAAAVDLNPNYMSRIFKTYTGKKISEYITELRIREAGTLLRESDRKIIDIALDVGFESLTTFNRSFRNIMGISPTEYREEALKPTADKE